MTGIDELLADNLRAWEGEEESVQEEHHELIARLRAACARRDALATSPDPVERAAALHEALMVWLRACYPQENPIVVLSACTYEIARIVTIVGKDLSDRERRDLLETVFSIMRAQIALGLTR